MTDQQRAAESAQLRSHAVRARESRVKLARSDVNTFIELVMRDEKTGVALEQAPIHEAWHQLADTHDRLVLISHIESGKTAQMAIGRTLHAIGRDQTLRCAIVSNTHPQAAKSVRALREYIDRSDELHEIFPTLGRSRNKKLPWGETAFTVERPFIAKDPTVQAVGVHGGVVGSRLDLVIVDDILDEENTASLEAMDKLEQWWNASIVGRLVDGARVIVIGTPWHPKDLLHRLAGGGRYEAVIYPVVHPATGELRWPARWPQERIDKRAAELGPLEAARQLYCVARDDTSSRFKRAWIQRCLDRGASKRLAYGLKAVPKGCRVYTGVDLAVQQHSSADLTVLFTIIVHPNEDREVLWIEAGRWTGPEIVSRIIDHHRRYMGISVVENNAAQDFILQFTGARSAVPVLPHTTGRNKAHPEFGIESLAAELAAGKWIIPCEGGIHPEVDAWIGELLYYDPRAHTGDRLMASWFAREGARKGSLEVQTGRMDLMRR